MITFAVTIQISIWNRWNQGHSNSSRVVRRHAIMHMEEWRCSSILNLRTRLLTSRSHCSHGKSLQYPFIKTLDGPQKTSGRFGEEVFFLSLHRAFWNLHVVHSPTNALFINLFKSFKFTLKYTIISLLPVSVFNYHHKEALSVPN